MRKWEMKWQVSHVPVPESPCLRVSPSRISPSPHLRFTASPCPRFSRICRIMSTLLASLKHPQVLQSGRQFGLRPAIAIES